MTTANAITAPVHDRMLVILDPHWYDLWLNPGMTETTAISELLKQFDAARMRCFPVDSRVNHAANDAPECSAPVEIAQHQGAVVPNGVDVPR